MSYWQRDEHNTMSVTEHLDVGQTGLNNTDSKGKTGAVDYVWLYWEVRQSGEEKRKNTRRATGLRQWFS